MDAVNQPVSRGWEPFRIDPWLSRRVWGYTDLRPWFNFVPANDPVGEVWLTGDQCRVATGPHTGQTLGGLFDQQPLPLLGADAPSPKSPLLIKVLFAREKLSVQVHPDDSLARKYAQPRGKTECWYVLAAEPGAQIALGLKPGATVEHLKAAIPAGTLEADLSPLPVSVGDLIFVDAGTVHALWPGSILLEVQQNSDITYRLYDYGRPRELHIEKGLEALRIHTRAGKVAPRELPDRTLLIDSEYFRLERVPIPGEITAGRLRGADAPDAAAVVSYLFAAAGTARISGNGFAPVEIGPRDIVCVPSAAPEFTVENLGSLDLIRISSKPAGHA
jgi:mannose-6-phosphate isomerase